MTSSEEQNISEYEDVLLGKRKNFACAFDGSYKEKCTAVGDIWRYAITRLLQWTPREAEVYLTDEVVNMLLLDKTLIAIDFDRRTSYIRDYRFVLQYAFPKEIQYDMRKEAILEYECVAKMGKWANDSNVYKYPKKFFLDHDGIKRAELLLNYVMNIYLSHLSPEEKYDLFANKSKAMKWLRSKKLDVACKVVFWNNTLDYLHCSLSQSEKDSFLYYSKKMDLEYENALKVG